jgi:hypothetical protein
MKRILSILLVLMLLAPSALAAVPDVSGLSTDELLSLRGAIDARLKESGYYPYIKLQSGDTGAEVIALQQRLQN